VLIIQHRRERFHPFNTARMVNRALANSRIICDRVADLARGVLPIGQRTGLLFPGPGALPIDQVSENQRPDQLVVIDGTWHHAKQIMRDVPQLRQLPQYKIQPDRPGQFRIRREPDETSLSTVEATVAALTALEPDIQGLEQLISAFHRMVEVQLAHPKARYGWRRNGKRHGTPFNIPFKLINDPGRIVVAYGESRGGERDASNLTAPVVRKPVYWVAERLGSAENFSAAILDSPATVSQPILRHLELDRRHFENARSAAEFRQAWREFLRPDETLMVYNQSTIR
jgi:DTW domain-containing protein YfiP